MDYLFKHLAQEPRRFNLVPPVSSIGFLPAKRDRIYITFDSYNFSFILSGQGTYVIRGKEYEVIAPCVITQWPGEPMDYGPADRWDEIYLIYPPETGAAWFDGKLFDVSRPIWYMDDSSAVADLVLELQREIRNPGADADRIDHLCLGMIQGSIPTYGRQPLNELERKIRQCLTLVEHNYLEPIDYAAFADRRGMSLSTFRRGWMKYVGVPPARYRELLVMREACRRLAETLDPIKDIAFRLGYDDPLYFSRRFHQIEHVTPSDYRAANRPRHAL